MKDLRSNSVPLVRVSGLEDAFHALEQGSHLAECRDRIGWSVSGSGGLLEPFPAAAKLVKFLPADNDIGRWHRIFRHDSYPTFARLLIIPIVVFPHPIGSKHRCPSGVPVVWAWCLCC